MLRPVLGLAAVGAVGYIVWQLLWTMLLPLLGTVVGFVLLMLKVLFIVLLVGVGVWVFRRLSRQEARAG